MKVDEIRDRFLKYFKDRHHAVYPSDSLVPANDPTLLFTGSGMNQFKNEFLGIVKGARRAATCQKCLRTADLENVGRTPDHHTFFEMLGNFSFGDYFKKEAIVWAWGFLTQELGIKKDDLWVSVYKDDNDAYGIWRDIVKIQEERILRLGEKENFWPSNAPSEGPDGPCGPCSEIFFGGPLAVEIWNLVFTQFDRNGKEALNPLPNKNIDTGMGLERIARVLQHKSTNFEIDSFLPIVECIKNLSRSDVYDQVKVNIISDHIRSITFAISDGVVPSNEDRGYVIRKLIRKAFWCGRGLGLDKPFLYKIVPVVSQVMIKPYPELVSQREYISRIVLEEEKRFRNTIDAGLNRLNELIQASRPSGILSGENAFRLYDTYGFPLELTKELSYAENVKVDMDGFERYMEKQRVVSKAGSKIKPAIFETADSLNLTLPDQTIFRENDIEIEAKVIAIIVGARPANEIRQAEKGSIYLNETNFYGEKGGQAGDKGVFLKNKEVLAEVLNAVDVAGRVGHLVQMTAGTIKLNDNIVSRIDINRRNSIKKNHTATHLLQAALRAVLGGHVKQSGSFVGPDRLHFDFSHFRAMTDDDIYRVEKMVNEEIRKNTAVQVDIVSLEDAKAMGAIMLFGEKYSQHVRMVSVAGYSRELCGGTHVRNTGEIGIFKIISESSIASGVRRIEAITGEAAYKKIKEESSLVKDIALELQTSPDNILTEINKKLDRIKQLEKIMEAFSDSAVSANADRLIKGAERVKDRRVIVAHIENADPVLLRKNADLIKEKARDAVFILISEKDGKLSMVVGFGDSVKDEKLDAVKILNEVGSVFGIKGGGRHDFSQAGGRSGPDVEEILNKAEEVVKKILSY